MRSPDPWNLVEWRALCQGCFFRSSTQFQGNAVAISIVNHLINCCTLSELNWLHYILAICVMCLPTDGWNPYLGHQSVCHTRYSVLDDDWYRVEVILIIELHSPNVKFQIDNLVSILLYLTQISPMFVPKGPLDDKTTLVEIMAWCCRSDKALSKQYWPNLVMHLWRIYALLAPVPHFNTWRRNRRRHFQMHFLEWEYMNFT